MPSYTVKLISLPVADPARAAAWYRDRLGFTVEGPWPFEGGREWWELTPPDGGAKLTLVTWFDSMPAGCLQGLVLETDDIDAAFSELSARGVEFSGPVSEQPWGRWAAFRDPDGNGWVLTSPPASS